MVREPMSTRAKICTWRPTVAPTKPLTEAEVRTLLAEGREVRKEIEKRLDRMHRIDPIERLTPAR